MPSAATRAIHLRTDLGPTPAALAIPVDNAYRRHARDPLSTQYRQPVILATVHPVHQRALKLRNLSFFAWDRRKTWLTPRPGKTMGDEGMTLLPSAVIGPVPVDEALNAVLDRGGGHETDAGCESTHIGIGRRNVARLQW